MDFKESFFYDFRLNETVIVDEEVKSPKNESTIVGRLPLIRPGVSNDPNTR